jgi:3-oxoadipate enol-lactonase
MPFVTVAGHELHYTEAGTGAPVLFLHAYPFNAAMWDYQLDEVAATHRAIALDLPGFGDSAPPADPRGSSMEKWSELVAGFIVELALEEPTIVAASMGGYLVFALIRQHAELLGDLVLVGTRAKSDDVETWQRRTDVQEALEGGEDPATLSKGMVEGLLSSGSLDRPELVEYVLALMNRNTAEGWIGALEAMKNRPDAMGAVKGLGHRTLVLVGELDRLTPLADATLITRLVSNGTLDVIPDSAHLPNLENPVAFNEKLLAFLNPAT